MRIYLKTTPNRELAPFNYQQYLVGTLHKWLGKNEVHDGLSLYSLSWLVGGQANGSGLNFPKGSTFFISSPSTGLIKRIIAGVKADPEINFGMKVSEAVLQKTPAFRETERFLLNSPVLIKRTVDRNVKFFYPFDEEADFLITETLRNKLKEAGMAELPVIARFDESYRNVKTKLVTYKGIKNKASFCPVILEGNPQAIAFAWEVGIGNSTGIGFGALK